MNESKVQEFLKRMQAVLSQLNLYPANHPNSQRALRDGWKAAADLAGDGNDDVVIGLKGYAFFLNGELLAYTSLMFANLYQDLTAREIESITLAGETDAEEYAGFVRYVGEHTEDFEVGGSIRINESRLVGPEDESAFADLRFSYSGVVGTLRNLDHRVAREGTFEMGPVMEAVEELIGQALGTGGASLLLSTVKSHDEYTFYHSVNTCLMAVATGRYLGLNQKDLVPIGAGALLHDIGKVAISPQILNYPGRLDREQWKEVTIHPQEGAQAIIAAGGPGHEIAATIALEHHARFDGLGYPRLGAEAVPHLASRLVAVSDVYDAITTRRSYRRAETPHRALQILLQGAGGAFDPDIVKSFISLMGIFPPGSVLRLLTGELVLISHHGGMTDRLEGVMVRTAAGEDIEPEPVTIETGQIGQQILAESVGIEPAALLERAGVAEQILASASPHVDEGAIERSGIDEEALKDQAARSLSSIVDRD
ncbi:MAG: HD-GYP domain-containing protein [Acidimicrobiia bacterium]|nr:HD-GYP domain-containing protein [Acidimicrobiia bacterium]MBT8247854.1 HD-GYP domain-containing protein [Acidimicrobiia bacterium]NNJ48152.1 HD-GYP domain-containing protein [Acidimicrobiia bacterium]